MVRGLLRVSLEHDPQLPRQRLGGEAVLSERVVGYVEQQRRGGQLPTGEVRLRPHWSRDWVALARAAASEPDGAEGA